MGCEKLVAPITKKISGNPRPSESCKMQSVSSVKPGQIWERRATRGAPWDRVRVLNVLGDEAEIEFLGDIKQITTTRCSHMLSDGGKGQGPEYRPTTEGF
jgi:hypothetical protein